MHLELDGAAPHRSWQCALDRVRQRIAHREVEPVVVAQHLRATEADVILDDAGGEDVQADVLWPDRVRRMGIAHTPGHVGGLLPFGAEPDHVDIVPAKARTARCPHRPGIGRVADGADVAVEDLLIVEQQRHIRARVIGEARGDRGGNVEITAVLEQVRIIVELRHLEAGLRRKAQRQLRRDLVLQARPETDAGGIIGIVPGNAEGREAARREALHRDRGRDAPGQPPHLLRIGHRQEQLVEVHPGLAAAKDTCAAAEIGTVRVAHRRVGGVHPAVAIGREVQHRAVLQRHVVGEIRHQEVFVPAFHLARGDEAGAGAGVAAPRREHLHAQAELLPDRGHRGRVDRARHPVLAVGHARARHAALRDAVAQGKISFGGRSDFRHQCRHKAQRRRSREAGFQGGLHSSLHGLELVKIFRVAPAGTGGDPQATGYPTRDIAAKDLMKGPAMRGSLIIAL
ncbi:hypothetical protein SDC9_34760 [bioreactor metagenome]|uniref:Uncharacterized protein n=1 Tax=bioreactor metagenome TaxID=1076179 RepID=A0A644VDE1_9ZZZZ